jgi:hypothetical protein
MYVHGLIWIAALWAVTFPGSTWALAILFRRLRPTAAGAAYAGGTVVVSATTTPRP